ncbi:MAG: hypothetical protein JWR80_470 [Bradyrhizobium sp.]|nr:hypothetical protein [Bradyrhizobium sp.]
MVRLVTLSLVFLTLAGCDLKIGRDNAPPSPSWIGQPVADFAARNPNATVVYGRDSLHVFEKETGYGKCEIVLETNGEVISRVVNLCPPGTVWLSPPLRHAAPEKI